MAEPKQGGDANAFIQEYGPIAERIGSQLNVDPRIILAQFGMETGWGKSVVPGTYNLGNIKSAGKGVEATDNVTKSKDRYLKFEDPEVFADYYANYIKRNFPEAIGSGSDVNAFTSALRPGTQGGYAQDKEYGPKLSNAFSLVSNRIESQPEQNPFEKTFGVGEKTEMQRMSEEGTTEGGDEKSLLERAVQSPADAAVAGAALLGVPAGFAARSVQQPVFSSPAKIDRAMDAVRDATIDLRDAKAKGATPDILNRLEQELASRKSVVNQLNEELKAAQSELKAVTKAPTDVPVSAIDEAAAASRKVPGSSGAANWVRAMGQDVPDVIAETAENMRKDNPKGGQAIIDRDVAAKQKIQQIGAGDYRLTGQGKSQLMLPPDLSAERTAAMEGELAQRQAQDAAERARLAQEAEAKRIAAENRVKAAQAQRQQVGSSVGQQSQQVSQVRKDLESTQKAERKLAKKQEILADVESKKPGPFQKAGLSTTGKVASKVAGVISGAGTGMAAYEAIEKAKAGDYSGAVLPTLEAVFGVMSMIPPFHPLAIAARGLGNIGGAALGAYELGKAGKERFIDQPQQ